ncbi:MAG: hypothetical protein CVU77_04300 [Elusimicrobia bacterium HGW-Elusimicrobia-1]|jgi:hypothetical protein|nr:MAG: hypothetical protein CVU77_04300 [Elusimicrobia bacterium HGW-Elusimicrobia-1]
MKILSLFFACAIFYFSINLVYGWNPPAWGAIGGVVRFFIIVLIWGAVDILLKSIFEKKKNPDNKDRDLSDR